MKSLKEYTRYSYLLTKKAWILSLWRDGWRLNKTISPSMVCRSTVSPYFSLLAIFWRSPYLRNLNIQQSKLCHGWTHYTRVLTQLDKNILSFYISLHSMWNNNKMNTKIQIHRSATSLFNQELKAYHRFIRHNDSPISFESFIKQHVALKTPV